MLGAANALPRATRKGFFIFRSRPEAKGFCFKEDSMFGVGSTELLVVLAIVVILFGGKKIPEIGAGLGKGIRNFKNATAKKEIDDKKDSEEKKEEE